MCALTTDVFQPVFRSIGFLKLEFVKIHALKKFNHGFQEATGCYLLEKVYAIVLDASLYFIAYTLFSFFFWCIQRFLLGIVAVWRMMLLQC